MPKRNILIAEDDPVLRDAYVRKFRRSGYRIRTAENGEVAVQMVGDEIPDLLICDILMPKRNGWWVLEQFPRGKRTFPIIMLTNLEDDETRRKCAELADGYFVKSIMTLVSLIDMTTKLLKGSGK